MKKILSYITLVVSMLIFGIACSDDDPVQIQPSIILSSQSSIVTVADDGLSATVNAEYSGGTANFTVTSPTQWRATLETDNDWCHITQANEKLAIALDEFIVALSNETDYRECRIKVESIVSEGLIPAVAIITVKQGKVTSGTTEISFETDILYMPSQGGIDSLEVFTTASEVFISDINATVPWISATIKTDKEGRHFLFLDARKNVIGETLSAIIEVTAGTGIETGSATLEVLQTNGALVLEYITTNDEEMISIPVCGLTQITVDWGDGSKPENIVGNFEGKEFDQPKHTYAKAGTYHVSIMGKTQRLRCYENEYIINHLNDIIQWGDLGLISLQQAFHGTKIQTIPPVLDPEVFANVTNIAQMFYGCMAIETIPEGLFDGLVNCTEMFTVFTECTNLREIPANLFAKTVKAENLNYLFDGCEMLSEIPEGLFDNMPNVKGMSWLFSGTSINTIPKDIFKYNTLADGFVGTFAECTGITEIPEGLFDANTEATSFNNLFRGCISLTKVPKDLFKNNTKTTKISSMFEGCIELTEVPEGIFDPFTALTDARYVFNGCTGIENISKDIFKNFANVTDYRGVFEGCTALNSIDKDIFKSSTKAKDFSNAFEGCTSLTEIPAGLFDSNTEVQYFTETFMECTSLKTFPTSLFDNNKAVTNVQSLFQGCTNLTGKTPFTMVDGAEMHLWQRGGTGGTKDYKKITDYYGGKAFSGCTKLSNWDDIPTKWKE